MPSNFKTYEAQARLLAAVLAATPGLKLDFKEIAKYYGESTPAGLEFQFRTIKKDAKALVEAYSNGGDPATALTGKVPATPGKRKAEGAAKSGGSTAKRVKKELIKEVKDLVDFEHNMPTPSKKGRQPLRSPAATPEEEMVQTPAESYDGIAEFKSIDNSFVKPEATSWNEISQYGDGMEFFGGGGDDIDGVEGEV